jgi:hypothetical protein
LVVASPIVASNTPGFRRLIARHRLIIRIMPPNNHSPRVY